MGGSDRDAGFRGDAPLVFRARREVGADPSTIWEALTAVGSWPRWHRRIGYAALRGELAAGTPLQWASDGMRFTSVLVEVDAPRRLGWTLRTFGGRGYLRWSLTELGGTPPRTHVELAESWEGLPVRLLGGTLRRTLEPSRSEWLDRLADHCGGQGTP